jgi:hypothetical protein
MELKKFPTALNENNLFVFFDVLIFNLIASKVNVINPEKIKIDLSDPRYCVVFIKVRSGDSKKQLSILLDKNNYKLTYGIFDKDENSNLKKNKEIATNITVDYFINYFDQIIISLNLLEKKLNGSKKKKIYGSST